MITIGEDETVSGLRGKAQEQDGVQKVLRSPQGTKALDRKRHRALTIEDWENLEKLFTPILGC